jgi:hypothetical protein
MAAYKDKAYYLCEIMSQSFVKSNSGTPGLRLSIKPVKELDYHDRTFSTDCPDYLRDFTMWFTNKSVSLHSRFLNELGWSGTFSDLDPSVEGHYSLVGKTIVLQNTVETRDGNSYDKFDYPQKPADQSIPEVAAELDQMFGGTNQ